MAIINNVNEIMHRIRCKLYPNYLPSAGGAFLARTSSEASLSIAQVCAALKSRGGYTGSYEELVKTVKQFFDEAAYQLCDGFAINTGYYTIHPSVGGTFDSANEPHNRKKHPVRFRLRTNSPLRDLASKIEINIEGLADVSGYIDEFRDLEEESINSLFIPGNQFSISGHKIKLAGDDPDVGIYFVPVEDPSKAIKVKRIAENSSSRIIGIAPDTEHLHNRIEVRTQFTGSGSIFLKKPRVITGDFVVEAA